MATCFLNSDPLLIHRGTVFRRQWDWNARVIFLLSAQNCLLKETQSMYMINLTISTWYKRILYQCASIKFSVQQIYWLNGQKWNSLWRDRGGSLGHGSGSWYVYFKMKMSWFFLSFIVTKSTCIHLPGCLQAKL